MLTAARINPSGSTSDASILTTSTTRKTRSDTDSRLVEQSRVFQCQGNALVINFLSHTMSVSGLRLEPGDPEKIAELEDVAGHRLPQDWRYLLEVAGGGGGALSSFDRVERTTAEDQFEFLPIDSLIRGQRDLATSPISETLGCPVFFASASAVSGARLVIAGHEAGAPLLVVEGTSERPQLSSHSFIATSLFTYLDALLVPPWIAERNRDWGAPLVSVHLGSQASDQNIEDCLLHFDSLLGDLCALDIAERGAPIGLQYLAGADHSWFGPPRQSAGAVLELPEGTVSSLRSGLKLLILAISMTAVLGGEVHDHCGCLGKADSRLSAEEAIRQLVSLHSVDGGIDELILKFRYRHF